MTTAAMTPTPKASVGELVEHARADLSALEETIAALRPIRRKPFEDKIYNILLACAQSIRELLDAVVQGDSRLAEAEEKHISMEQAAGLILINKTEAEKQHARAEAAEARVAELIEQAAKIVEGELYKERYRKWPCVSLEGNRSEDSDVAKHCAKLAQAVRALSPTEPAGRGG